MKKLIILGALIVVSCAKIVENDTVIPSNEIKTIPYSVTVGSDETRATVDGDMMTIRYAAGDKLYLESETRSDVKGILTLKSGDEGKTAGATFEGTLSYAGDAPSYDLVLKATLVGSSNVGIQIGEDDKVTGIQYPELKTYCTDVNEAVQKYSHLTGEGYFGEKLFPLSQHTSFLNFTITLGGDTKSKKYSVYIANEGTDGGKSNFLGDMTTTKSASNKYGVHFVLPVKAGTVLKNASVHFITFGGLGTSAATYSANFRGSEEITLSPKVYNVTRTTALHSGDVDTGLPVIRVTGTTAAQLTQDNKKVERPVTVSITGAGKYPDIEGLDATIKGRGNTTWDWAKKPYKLKLTNKASLLGMESSKHWVLLANFMDRTMMRNLVAMKISSMMTNLAWTPSCVPVELYIGDQHLGTYLLIEQVRVAKKRVNVKEIERPESGQSPILPEKGGYLLELDFHFDNEVQWEDPHGHTKQKKDWDGDGTSEYDGVPFSLKSPDIEDFTTTEDGISTVDQIFYDYRDYIRQYVFDTAEALYASDFKHPATGLGYENYLDIDSFIDYWLVFELMINHELSNPGSVYMYKKEGATGKLYAGPCWDYDWGTLSYNYTPSAETSLVNADANSMWYGRFFEDPSFKLKLKTRFNALKSEFMTIPNEIDNWERELAVSAIYNFKMWNPAEDKRSNGGKIINGDENLTFEQAVARIKTIYNERLGLIETLLNE